MSIGDRHADNSLINKRTGDEVSIDFGHAFGSAFFLPVPELLPFRFTPAIQGMLLPFKKGQGLTRDIMMHVLKVLRENESVLSATLSTFIREPTIDWLEFASKSAAKNQEKLTLSWSQRYVKRKIDTVKKKIKGVHPIVSAIEELADGKGKDYSKINQVIIIFSLRSFTTKNDFMGSELLFLISVPLYLDTRGSSGRKWQHTKTG